MSASDMLKEIYAKFYAQREVLEGAPELSQSPDDEAFDTQKADTELAKVISYLMGVSDIKQESFEHALEIIQEHYASQPEWKELLVDYFEYINEKEKEDLLSKEDAIVKEIEEFTEKLLKE